MCQHPDVTLSRINRHTDTTRTSIVTHASKARTPPSRTRLVAQPQALLLLKADLALPFVVFDGPLDGGIHEGPVALMTPAAAAARGLAVPDDDR